MPKANGSKVAAMREHREAQVAHAERNGKPHTLESIEERIEAALDRGRAAFIAVGEALGEIRESKLYRDSHGTFEAYCLARWGFSRSHAYRMIEGADVVALLSPIGDKKPRTESVARELGKLPEEERAEAWEEAVEANGGEDPTARGVREVVEGRQPLPHETETPDDDAPDPLAEWERTAKELDAATRTIEALQSSDLAKKYTDLAANYGRLEGRLQQEITTRGEIEKAARSHMRLLREISKALKVEDFREIVAAIQDLRR